MSKAPQKTSVVKKPIASKAPAARKAVSKTPAAKTPRVRAAKGKSAMDEIQPTDPYVEALAAKPAAPTPDPEELPQSIVDWQPVHQRDDGVALAKGHTLSAGAAGALAFGALALAGFAIGAVAVGRLSIGSARARRMEIGHLVVGKISMLKRR